MSLPCSIRPKRLTNDLILVGKSLLLEILPIRDDNLVLLWDLELDRFG